MLFRDSGKIIEEINQSLSATLTERGFEMLGQYASAESPECSVLVFSHPERLTTFSGLRTSVKLHLKKNCPKLKALCIC